LNSQELEPSSKITNSRDFLKYFMEEFRSMLTEAKVAKACDKRSRLKQHIPQEVGKFKD